MRYARYIMLCTSRYNEYWKYIFICIKKNWETIQRQCKIADIMYIIGIFNFFQIMVLGMGYERCIGPLAYKRKIKYIYRIWDI